MSEGPAVAVPSNLWRAAEAEATTVTGTCDSCCRNNRRLCAAQWPSFGHIALRDQRMWLCSICSHCHALILNITPKYDDDPDDPMHHMDPDMEHYLNTALADINDSVEDYPYE